MKNYVLTITPNPSLDLSGTVDNLKPNEKSYVYDETRSPGGSAINVARILTRLNIPVLASGFFGGSSGDEIKNLLDQEGVKNRIIKIKGHSRICVSVSNQSDNKQTRLDFPGPIINQEEKNKLFKLFEGQKKISLLVLGGSLPKGLRPADVLRLMRLAKKQNIECIIDCPGNILRELIAGPPYLSNQTSMNFKK